MSGYLDGGTDSQFAREIYALQRASFRAGVQHVVGTMRISLEDKRQRFDDSTTLTAEKLRLSSEIDLLEKMIQWAEEQVEDL